MLDNFTQKAVHNAIQINKGKAKLEVSGGINLKNIRAFAKTGVDYISAGAITHSVRAMDLSMLIEKI